MSSGKCQYFDKGYCKRQRFFLNTHLLSVRGAVGIEESVRRDTGSSARMGMNVFLN